MHTHILVHTRLHTLYSETMPKQNMGEYSPAASNTISLESLLMFSISFLGIDGGN